ncbi:MAG: PAS domain S-box protein, partial [Campylobacteraceae bacterium]|nr:PAS domain S-box protein [Campylobacteraceae bacterium]
QANDAKVINTGGQQIMLSQQIALYAIYYQTLYLEKSISQMEDNHNFLLSLPMSEELRDIYFAAPDTLDVKVKAYIQNAKRFRDTTDGKSITYVLQNADKLLLDLEKAAKVYLREAEERTDTLRNFEILICIATLFTLLLEAIFIFRPAAVVINKKTKELLEEKNYSNAVIESSTNALISIDKNYNVKTYNKTAERIFGFKKEEMRDVEKLLRIVPKFYKAIHKRGLNAFFAKISPRLMGKTYQVKLLNDKNEQFPCRISFGKALKDGIVVINIENITKEKLKDTLLHKQAKFAALGEMIAIIAHQWRQPLAELGLNNLYLKKKIKQDELREELGKNEDIIRFMSETITDFEDFYRHGENGWFDPNEAVRKSINIVENILKLKEIALSLKLGSHSLVYGQQNSLSQVVLSILQNSIDKHNITKSRAKRIEIKTKEVDKRIVLSIKDNAGGISVTPIEAIFEPFYTGKKSSSTGLGLYMSKLVIEEKFNGTITASNTKVGALLEICLSVSNQAYIQASQRSL